MNTNNSLANKWNARPFLMTLGCAALMGVGLTAAPLVARAQGQDAQMPGSDPNSNSDASNQLIKLDLENADLYSALKLLFAQVKANYTLAPGLRQFPVTAHLDKIPFRIALDTLLRGAASPVPLTYHVESGIYSILERKEVIDTGGEATTPDIEPPRSNRLTYKKFFGSTGELRYNSAYIAKLLNAKLIPSIVAEQTQGGFGSGGFGGGLGSGSNSFGNGNQGSGGGAGGIGSGMSSGGGIGGGMSSGGVGGRGF